MNASGGGRSIDRTSTLHSLGSKPTGRSLICLLCTVQCEASLRAIIAAFNHTLGVCAARIWLR
eukprot:scaffold595053_cov15-Prasinocladus_malaysianus.AAC.1